MTISTIGQDRVLWLDADGAPLGANPHLNDAISEAFSAQASVVAIPVARLEEQFFQLKTKVAGEVLQKFVNYHLRVAIVGDITRHTGASRALADFVTESNRGRHVWFVPTPAALEARLAAGPSM